MGFLYAVIGLGSAFIIYVVRRERRMYKRYIPTYSEGEVQMMQRPERTILVYAYTPSSNGHSEKNATH